MTAVKDFAFSMLQLRFLKIVMNLIMNTSLLHL